MLPDRSEMFTSVKNPKLQLVRSLLLEKSTRSELGLFIIEGIRLAEEVLNSNIIPNSVFFTSQISERGREIVKHARDSEVEVHEVSPEVMKKISDTETTQGILMVVPQTAIPLPALTDLVLILDQVRDPGNCGTILRTAAAAGVRLVFSTFGSADLFMPKVVRSAMGAHFRMCIRQTDWSEILNYCRPENGVPLEILLAESAGGKSVWQVNLKTPLALIIGGEAEGASAKGRSAADMLVNIPMPGHFESLNAGVAASILLFEIVRQRTT